MPARFNCGHSQVPELWLVRGMVLEQLHNVTDVLAVLTFATGPS